MFFAELVDHADVVEVAEMLIVVECATHDELVGHLETDEIWNEEEVGLKVFQSTFARKITKNQRVDNRCQ